MSLHLYMGCMYSGKSTKCVNHFKEFTRANKRVCVINYYHDNRYDDVLLSTHDRVKIPCKKMLTLLDNIGKIRNDYDVFLINEGQFFVDLYDSVVALVEKFNKDVYIYGLDSDYQRKPFGQIIDLIPICTSVTKLYANCHICKKDNQACFTHRLSTEKEQYLIGNNIYIPVCRKCYLNSI